MSNTTEHPIATPKGAAAVSIVLAVLGVFTPFFVDLKAALGFAVLCTGIIVWLYLADISRSVGTKSFGGSLLVPMASLVAIGGMAIFAVTGKKPVPTTSPALTNADVARQLDNWLEQHQNQVAPQPNSVAPRPVVINIPTLEAGTKRKADPTPQQTTAQSSDSWRDTMEEIRKRSELTTNESKCERASFAVILDIARLEGQAANYQNSWAYTRDDRELLNQYQRWLGAVQQVFTTNKEALKDTSAFDDVKEASVEGGFLVVRNVRGEAVWGNFDTKRKALGKIRAAYEASVCSAEREAVKAFDAERAAKAR